MSKTSFIEKIAEQILEENKDPGKATVLFPNRRAGLFFRYELGKKITRPIWMPKVYSLEDFILEKSELEKIDTLEAVYLLYDTYKDHQPRSESFDRFFFWGEMIIRDFEEIDQYLVNADQLFTSIKSQKELDEEFFFLDELDKEIIQSFWSTFLPEASQSQQAFLETWKLLKPIYNDFQKRLLDRKKGYGGLIYRNFLEKINDPGMEEDANIYFAGFNALTFAEEKIIKYYVREHNASIHWDVDQYYLNDQNQEAGYFMRQYAKDPLLGNRIEAEAISSISLPKKISLTGVSLEVGQTKALTEDLEEIVKEKSFKPEKCVVVLPHEYMLFSVLESLPESIENVNITMGYPLKDTPVFSLLDSVLFLQESRRESITQGVSFYNKPALEIFEHPLVFATAKTQLAEKASNIRKRNLIYIYQDDIPGISELVKLIFQKPGNSLDYLLAILGELHRYWQEEKSGLELEFISRFYKSLNTLKSLFSENSDHLNYSFLRKLLNRISRSLKIPFTGEPLNGLQIMGILETRNLDFDHVFVLNMNEDSWPAPPKKGSFIPYNIRRAFQLPTNEHQDAIYSYLFYRLLQRAKNVHFYYNTVAEFNINGEISRLVRQLEYESGHAIVKKILSNPIKVVPPKEIKVEKTDLVFNKLSRFIVKENQKYFRLSPSALETYLYCRLRFYFKYVEELYEPEDLQEEMDPMVFGNILHDAMEILFRQYTEKNKRKVIDQNDFFGLEAGIRGAIHKAFTRHYDVRKKEKFELEGSNLIAASIIEKTMRKILTFDRDYTPFRILGLEAGSRQGYKLDYQIEIDGKKYPVGLKGNIDRIDIRQGVVRVIDYKTGRDEKQFESVYSLIERANKKRNKAAFQVFFYSYLFYKNFQGAYDRIEPGLYNSRDLFSDEFRWQIEDKENGFVNDFRDYVEEFEDILQQLLSEIWDRDVPFDQVEDHDKCKYCPYIGICNRD